MNHNPEHPPPQATAAAKPKRDRKRKKNGRLTARERRRIARANSRASTGPKSEIGRRTSSMNACKNLMRIENFRILNEKCGDLTAGLEEWYSFYRPASPGERRLCQSAFVAGVMQDRVLISKTEAINDRIRTARIRYDQAQEDALQEAIDLLHSQPAKGIYRIKRSAIGCRWLLLRYRRLLGLLERDGTLLGNDRSEYITLSGSEPYIDKLFESEDAYLIWLFCEASKPETQSERMQVLGDEAVMPIALRDRDPHTWLPPKPFCRSLLRERLEEEIERLTRREEQLRLTVEDPGREGAEKAASELTDKDGDKFARYYNMYDHRFSRSYSTLVQDRERTARTGRIPGAPTEAVSAPAEAVGATIETVGATNETVGAPNEADGASGLDATSHSETTSMGASGPDLAPDFAADADALRRRETAEAVAPNEANGIAAPICRGDRFLTVILKSRWWEKGPKEAPDDETRGEAAHGRPPEARRRE
jgi:hypothetical protein